jgi:hypothetical protein
MTHLCTVKIHSSPDRSTKWLCVQSRFVPLVLIFCSMILYVCQFHPYQRCPVRCDGCGILFFRTDGLRQCYWSVFRCDTVTVPFFLPQHHLFPQDSKFLHLKILFKYQSHQDFQIFFTSNFFFTGLSCQITLVHGSNTKMILILSQLLVPWIVRRITKVGRDMVR